MTVVGPTLPQVLLSFGLLTVVPIGLDSFRWSHGSADRLRAIALRLVPVTGTLAVVSFFLPVGLVSAVLAGTWFLTAAFVSTSALVEVIATRSLGIESLMRSAASGYILVGAGWLVLSRLGARPLDFSDVVVELTAVHFHFAGFAAPLVAAPAIAYSKTTFPSVSKAAIVSGLGVVVGMPIVAAGITAFPALEMAGSVLIGLSLSVLAIATLILVLRTPMKVVAKGLLAISSISVIAAMVLAIQYALGQYLGTPALQITQMAQLHGTLNAVGFSLFGLLGWRFQSGVV